MIIDRRARAIATLGPLRFLGFSGFRAATVLTVMAILSPVATSAAVPDLCDQACLADMERARAATSAYRNADTAVADGFIETGGCISSAEGTASIQWFNAGRFNL